MSHSYSGTFESMLEILLYVCFKTSPATVRDVKDNVSDLYVENIRRRMNGLVDSGFLEVCNQTAVGEPNTYRPTEKAFQMLNIKVSQ